MNATKYLSYLALTCLALLTFYSRPSEACSCMPSHPQGSYCKADYVILVRVLRKSTRLVKNQVAYKVQVKRFYKTTPEAQKVLKHNRLLTAAESAACGVNLELGKLYVIVGRGRQLSLCNYIKEYKKMSTIERIGFSNMYQKGCSCEVTTCFGNDCQHNSESAVGCKWSPFSECETQHSFCMPASYATPEGPIEKCRWRRTPSLEKCLSNNTPKF